MTASVFKDWRAVLAVGSAVTICLVGACLPAAYAARETQDDDRAPFRIMVEIDGVPTASFRSVSGLSAETEVVEFQEGAIQPRFTSSPDARSTRISY